MVDSELLEALKLHCGNNDKLLAQLIVRCNKGYDEYKELWKEKSVEELEVELSEELQDACVYQAMINWKLRGRG